MVLALKLRLDQLLINLHLASDIEKARALIGAGEVYVDDCVSDKAGLLLNPSVSIRLKEKCPFVSRGGLKLNEALSTFKQPVNELICIDIGASSGGFTDCLLQHGAKKVYAIDVAYGQLAWKIRQDERVEVLERFNARQLTSTDIHNDDIGLVVIDVSFISLTKILPVVFELFTGPVAVVALVKPQFELPKCDIGPGGVVIEPHLHEKAVAKVQSFVESCGYRIANVTVSPILGPKGNTEFLVHIISY
jgi:23S rRNA (cytidine1920-2'-O)/16S rRNA (cytidine1409-2'-O)-methyltransferase